MFQQNGCHSNMTQTIFNNFAPKVAPLKVSKVQIVIINLKKSVNKEHSLWLNTLLPNPNRVK